MGFLIDVMDRSTLLGSSSFKTPPTRNTISIDTPRPSPNQAPHPPIPNDNTDNAAELEDDSYYSQTLPPFPTTSTSNPKAAEPTGPAPPTGAGGDGVGGGSGASWWLDDSGVAHGSIHGSCF